MLISSTRERANPVGLRYHFPLPELTFIQISIFQSTDRQRADEAEMQAEGWPMKTLNTVLSDAQPETGTITGSAEPGTMMCQQQLYK